MPRSRETLRGWTKAAFYENRTPRNLSTDRGLGGGPVATTPVNCAKWGPGIMRLTSSRHHKRDQMSDDAPLATRDLPYLAGRSLRELRRATESPLDLALSRILEEDKATSGASAGFQNRM
ncbi:hypothetical protein GCM10027176_26220 [Actinoallomurus bryophytorum]